MEGTNYYKHSSGGVVVVVPCAMLYRYRVRLYTVVYYYHLYTVASCKYCMSCAMCHKVFSATYCRYWCNVELI